MTIQASNAVIAFLELFRRAIEWLVLALDRSLQVLIHLMAHLLLASVYVLRGLQFFLGAVLGLCNRGRAGLLGILHPKDEPETDNNQTRPPFR